MAQAQKETGAKKATGQSVAANRRTSRLRRHARLRKKIAGTAERPRLVVNRSSRHIHVQLVNDLDGTTLAAASSGARPYRCTPGLVTDGVISGSNHGRSIRA